MQKKHCTQLTLHVYCYLDHNFYEDAHCTDGQRHTIEFSVLVKNILLLPGKHLTILLPLLPAKKVKILMVPVPKGTIVQN